ncbi:MAG: hypothetical protein LC785_03655 [Acidobacteria bacterium]|nr:hypothetical protein [Acidobacteriota bacterium]MCA1641079.1 hypothetical protein [Acidobacteriota bacterium]
MSEKVLKELIGSVREFGQVLRGERAPSRVFERAAPRRRKKSHTRFAVCMRTDDPALLIPRKIYEVTPLASGRVSVVDEGGETAIYPADNFILMELPREVEEALSRVA